MMWKIGKHESIDGTGRYEAAYEWYQRMPGFLFAICERYSPVDRELFIESLDQGINFYAEAEGELVGLVHAELKTDKIVEGHLFAAPQARIEILSSAISYARIEVLKKYELVVCHVHSRHRTLQRIMDLSGFRDTGLRAWQGVYRKHLQEIRYYTATRI